MNTVDNAIALRIVYLLTLPFNEWPAFSEGIINADGDVVQKGASSDNWTMLHRLVARLKVLLGKLPGGGSRIASIAAAYLLVKENLNNEDCEITEATLSSRLVRFSEFSEFSSLLALVEDAGVVPANSTENVAGVKAGDEPPKRIRKKILKRTES